MTLINSVLLCVLVLSCFTITNSFSKRFGGGHKYPGGSGLSGHGSSSHSHPSSGHSYPSARPGQLSGGTNYPSQHQPSHSYPSGNPGQLSGSGSKYPSNTNSHGYSPSSQPGYNYHSPSNTYKYQPPQQVQYSGVHGGPPVSYPVYHGPPPTYVYQYKESGSKFGTLLTGLALFNLGAVAGGVAGHSLGSHSNSYKAKPGEVCKLGIRKDNGDYEENRIDCQIVTNLAFDDHTSITPTTNTTIVTSTVTNVTTVNTEVNTVPDSPHYIMLPNGTVVPGNETTTVNSTAPMNATSEQESATNGTITSTVTSTTNTTVITNATEVKGDPIKVTPGMKCYIIRNTPNSVQRKTVSCGLLEAYAKQSLQKNSANRNTPYLALVSVILVTVAMY